MRYSHKDGDRAASSIKVPGIGSVSVADGVFEADTSPAAHERLVDLGHEPLDDQEDTDDDAEAEETSDEPDEQDTLSLADVSEADLVEMDRNDLRALASEYDDINGNASADKLTEELIAKRRDELDDKEE